MNHAGEQYPAGFPITNVGGWATIPRRPLAIVGSHPKTRENAPYDDPRFEIWLFNESAQKPEIYRRWDAVVQIHKPDVYSSLENWVNKDHWAWLQEDHGRGKTIWLQEYDPFVPNSQQYPLEEVLTLVPYRYLRSSPAMALALAIYLGYTEIWLYGSELSSGTEYTYQAINYAFWIGFAHGRGVDLHLECWHNEFYEQPIYGYEGERQISKDYFRERMTEHERAWTESDKALKQTKNRLGAAMLENKYDLVGQLSIEIVDIALICGQASGAMGEAERYHRRTNDISRQEFERVSAQAQIDGDKIEKDIYHAAGKCEYVWNVWRQTGRNEPLNQLRAFIDEKLKAAYETGIKVGVFQENIHYIGEYDRLVTAFGGARAVAQVEAMVNG